VVKSEIQRLWVALAARFVASSAGFATKACLRADFWQRA
jgi:hypothetical protein